MCFFFLELVRGQDLHSWIEYHKSDRSIDFHLKAEIGYNISRGICYLHSLFPPILHGDLKSPNILIGFSLSDPTASDGPLQKKIVTVKIADFGTSHRLYDKCVKGSGASEREVGNPTWLAPEILASKNYSLPSDVYAFGIILWEIISMDHPYGEFAFSFMLDLENAVVSGQRPTMPDCPPSFADLIKACWENDPNQRPTMHVVHNVLFARIMEGLGMTPDSEVPVRVQRPFKKKETPVVFFEGQSYKATDLATLSEELTRRFAQERAVLTQRTLDLEEREAELEFRIKQFRDYQLRFEEKYGKVELEEGPFGGLGSGGNPNNQMGGSSCGAERNEAIFGGLYSLRKPSQRSTTSRDKRKIISQTDRDTSFREVEDALSRMPSSESTERTSSPLERSKTGDRGSSGSTSERTKSHTHRRRRADSRQKSRNGSYDKNDPSLSSSLSSSSKSKLSAVGIVAAHAIGDSDLNADSRSEGKDDLSKITPPNSPNANRGSGKPLGRSATTDFS